jgi:hypothetical protein
MLPFLKPSFSFAIQTTPVEQIGKLLLNSWSAEYALRITPLVNDELYLQNTLHWTLPQAYYAAMFGARAVLLTTSQAVIGEPEISKSMQRFHQAGYYQPDFTADCNPFEEVLSLRASTKQQIPIPDDVRTYQQKLIEQGERIARCHERMIMRTIGVTAYRQTVVAQTPDYLRKSFVDDRTTILLCELSQKGGVTA